MEDLDINWHLTASEGNLYRFKTITIIIVIINNVLSSLWPAGRRCLLFCSVGGQTREVFFILLRFIKVHYLRAPKHTVFNAIFLCILRSPCQREIKVCCEDVGLYYLYSTGNNWQRTTSHRLWGPQKCRAF